MQYLVAISKTTEWSVCFQGKPFIITIIHAYAPTSNAEEAEVEWFYEDLQDLLELTPKTDVLFIIKDWDAKVGSLETPGITGKFGLGIRNEAGQRVIEFCQENALVTLVRNPHIWSPSVYNKPISFTFLQRVYMREGVRWLCKVKGSVVSLKSDYSCFQPHISWCLAASVNSGICF